MASVNQDGHRTILVILGSTQRYADAQALLAHYRTYYGWITLTTPDNTLKSPPRSQRRAALSGHWPGADGLSAYVAAPWWPRCVNAWLMTTTCPGAPAGVVHFLQGNQDLGTQSLMWGTY